PASSSSPIRRMAACMSEAFRDGAATPVPGASGAPRRLPSPPPGLRRLALPLLVLFCLLLVLFWPAREQDGGPLLLEGGTMGTRYSLQLPVLPEGYDEDRLAEVVQARLDRL